MSVSSKLNILRILCFCVFCSFLHNSCATGNFSFLVSSGYRPREHILSKHLVSIRFAERQRYFGDSHVCGGSILSPKVILTAAHCVANPIVKMNHYKIFIVAGTPNRLKQTEKSQIKKVKKIIPHEKYDPDRVINDIALLILATDIEEDNNTSQRVTLSNAAPQPGMSCVVLGWGTLFYGGPIPAVVLHGDLNILEEDKCRGFLEELYQPGMICAKNLIDYEIDSCQGDSGGPLFCNGMLTGIVSFGGICGTKDASGVYTNVFYFRDWIKLNCACRGLKDNLGLPILATVIIVLGNAFKVSFRNILM